MPKEILKIKYATPMIKRLSMPRDGDVGIDLYAAADTSIELGDTSLINTGVYVQPPEGYWLQIIDRSSVSKYCHVMAGVIDETYRGEIKVRMFCHRMNTSPDEYPFKAYVIKEGDKIAQMILRRNHNRDFSIVEADELTDTDRGDGGFGSTGK